MYLADRDDAVYASLKKIVCNTLRWRMKLRNEGSFFKGRLGASVRMLVASGALAIAGGMPIATNAAQAQAAPAAETAKVASPAGAVRMKPLSKTAKAAPTGGSVDAASPVTTGSVAKMAGAAAAPAAGKAAGKASGRCTRIAFEVNDYGKDGPTKDAKSLLDKHIATWAAEKGIKKYTVGNKLVNCRLFLDFIVFDEHTCRAEAPVCW
jgi:hypothetical protein